MKYITPFMLMFVAWIIMAHVSCRKSQVIEKNRELIELQQEVIDLQERRIEQLEAVCP
jgi:hypothetical protein